MQQDNIARREREKLIMDIKIPKKRNLMERNENDSEINTQASQINDD